MKKFAGLLFMLSLHTAIFAQIHLTDTGREIQGSDALSKDLEQGFVFHPNEQVFQKLYHSESIAEKLVIHIDAQETVTLSLERAQLFAQDYRLRGMTHEGRVDLEADLGKHYRGKVDGSPESWVAFSIFRDQVSALIVLPKRGTFALGRMKTPVRDGFSHIVYEQSHMRNAPTFHCHTGELEKKFLQSRRMPESKGSSEADCKAVRLYAEFDYYTYNNRFNRNLDDANAYASFLLNMTVAMYAQEDVRLIVSEVFLWTVPDSYTRDNSGDPLREFTNDYRNDFNGDIGALIATVPNGNGGLAWLNVLCAPYIEEWSFGRTSYSNTSTWVRQIPAYSWDVNVLVHEIGHNLGSPHTHDCFWNGDNTPIDDCAGEFDEDFRDTRCDPGPLPGAGTIMSYCHLNVGVDFSLGFGPQPAELIRNQIAEANCLQVLSNVDTKITREDVFGQADPEKICLGDSLRLTVDEGYTYQWSDNQTSSSIFVNAPGIYSVTVFDADGCPEEYLDTVEMSPLPQIDYFLNDSLYCPGDTAVISISRDSQVLISYNEWAVDSTIELVGTDTIEILMLDTLSTCSNADTIFVAFNSSPELNYRSADSAGLCIGDTTEISFDRLDSIFLEGARVISDTSFRATAGSYPMAGYLDGCVTKDTLTLEGWALPKLSLKDSFFFCDGGSIALMPEDPEDSTVLYRWNGIDTGFVFEVDSPGMVAVEAISAFGCMSEAQTQVFRVDLPDSLSIDYSYTAGDTVYRLFQNFPLDSFRGRLQWTLPEGRIIAENRDSLIVSWMDDAPDSVSVCVFFETDHPAECRTDSFCIQVPTSLILSTSHRFDPSILVYPNPFDRELRVEWPKAYYLNGLELWNSAGQRVWASKEEVLSVQKIQIPTSHLIEGVYWLRATTEEGIKSFPVIKME